MHRPLQLQLPRSPITVALWQRMVEAGVLGEDDKVELIEGDIVPMSPQGKPHTVMVGKIRRAFAALDESEWELTIQSSVPLGDLSQPEPDLAVVLRSELTDPDAACHPALCIEVANTSIESDRQKTRLYASYGVPEYWIVDVNAATIEIYTDPDPESARYRALRTLASGTVTPAAFAGVTIDVARLFSSSRS